MSITNNLDDDSLNLLSKKDENTDSRLEIIDNKIENSIDINNEYTDDFYKTDKHRKLNFKFNIWYLKCSTYITNEEYESKLKIIGSFETIEQFWKLYSFLKRSNELEDYTQIFVFRYNVLPKYEHGIHKFGGKWIIKINKNYTARCWENLLLAYIGDNYDRPFGADVINGIVLSIKPEYDNISLWNFNSFCNVATNNIKTWFLDKIGIQKRFIYYYYSKFADRLKNNKIEEFDYLDHLKYVIVNEKDHETWA